MVAAAARLGCTPAQVLLLGAAAWRLTPSPSPSPSPSLALPPSPSPGPSLSPVPLPLPPPLFSLPLPLPLPTFPYPYPHPYPGAATMGASTRDERGAQERHARTHPGERRCDAA